MKPKMEIGKRYIVTQKSRDGTFRVGDRISLGTDDSIICHNADGWIDRENVEEATKEMKVEIDIEWIKNRLSILKKEIEELERITGINEV